MNTKELKTRDQIDSKYKWNIEAMIPDESVISGELETIKKEAEAYGEDFAGRLTESADTLLAAFQKRDDIWRRLEKIYVYARMRRDENNAETKYQAMADQCNSVIAAVSASMAFFTPELLSASEETILAYIDAAPGLEIYRFAICDTMRQKAHILTQAEENILAQMSEITGATNDIFTMLNNADIKFGTIIDEDGDETEVTHGNFIKFMESHDRDVRKNAYNAVYDAYKELINTIASAYNYNTKTDVVSARIRKYESARAAALSGDNIPAEVYDNLVAEVHKNLPAMHRYVELRKKLLGVDKLYMYDMYVPLIKLPETSVSFEEGLDIMRDALQPLGEEYLTKMNKGIEEGWIDVYENKGKTSGAYSFGCYDSYPYILLNYTDTLKDVFTIIHEMGHSIHTWYSDRNQPFTYAGYKIFVAEVASTCNEALLIRHLLKKAGSREEKAYLLNHFLESFRGTLFRQTMFAEFEDMAHKKAARGESLTAESLCSIYRQLNADYFGPAMTVDRQIDYEWERIPHFYTPFYVYQYATGFSAAVAISSRIMSGEPGALEGYKKFLSGGCSMKPIDLLKLCGVDMSTTRPVDEALGFFRGADSRNLKKCIHTK